MPTSASRAAKGSTATSLSTTYEPTPKELAAARRYKDRTDAAPPRPKLQITSTESDGVRSVKIEINHPDPALGWALMTDSLGASTGRITEVVIDQVAALAQTSNGVNEADVNRMLALIQGIEPQDPVETMLAVQMAAIHMATIKQAQILNGALERSSRYPVAESASTALNKLSRTFTTQMDALKRHRSKGEQKVVVEHQHVHVYPGGQAVVTQGGNEKNGDQPHERQLRISERTAVLSTIEADRVPVPGAGDDRLESLPVSRGKGRPALRTVE